jgi:hypothetical protein
VPRLKRARAALLKQLVAGVELSPRPTVINCRAGGAFCFLWPSRKGV